MSDTEERIRAYRDIQEHPAIADYVELMEARLRAKYPFIFFKKFPPKFPASANHLFMMDSRARYFKMNDDQMRISRGLRFSKLVDITTGGTPDMNKTSGDLGILRFVGNRLAGVQNCLDDAMNLLQIARFDAKNFFEHETGKRYISEFTPEEREKYKPEITRYFRLLDLAQVLKAYALELFYFANPDTLEDPDHLENAIPFGRFFLFDENGEMVEVSEEQYNKACDTDISDKALNEVVDVELDETGHVASIKERE